MYMYVHVIYILQFSLSICMVIIYRHLSLSLLLAVTVDFLEPVFTVDEGQGNVSVCLTIDTPTATPLIVSLEATLFSADGKFVHTYCSNN